MALDDILIHGGDPQNGILEIPTGSTINRPSEILSDTGIEELILTGGGGGATDYAFIG